MAENGALCSMSRLGNVWDNAVMESFFLVAENREVGLQTISRYQARADVFDYIERFYNPVRSTLRSGTAAPLPSSNRLRWLNHLSFKPGTVRECWSILASNFLRSFRSK